MKKNEDTQCPNQVAVFLAEKQRPGPELNELVNAEDDTSQRWLFTTGMFTTHLG